MGFVVMMRFVTSTNEYRSCIFIGMRCRLNVLDRIGRRTDNGYPYLLNIDAL